MPAATDLRIAEELAVRLAASLLRAGLADGRDWDAAKRKPVRFLERTLARWVGAERRRAIERRMGVQAAFRQGWLDDPYWGQEPDEMASTLCLVVEATGYTHLYIGETVTLLEAAHPRYPVTWWGLAQDFGLCLRLFTFDDMDWYLECRWEEAEDTAAGPPTLRDIIPASILRGERLTDIGLRRVLTRRGPGRAEDIMDAALRMSQAARRVERPDWRLTDAGFTEWEDPIPAVAIAVEAHDECVGAMDFVAEHSGQLSGVWAPSCWWTLDPDRPETLHAAHRNLDACCEMLLAMDELMALTPGNARTVADVLAQVPDDGLYLHPVEREA